MTGVDVAPRVGLTEGDLTRCDRTEDGGRRVSPRPAPDPSAAVAVTYQPILDVARGSAAGFQAQGSVAHDARAGVEHLGAAELETLIAVAVIRKALDDFPTLPTNTFVSIPLGVDVAAGEAVQAALAARPDLSGVVLEIVGFSSGLPFGELDHALAGYRERGAKLSVGGHGAAQPELTSIVRLKPAIIRLGRDWTRGIDRSEAKRSAIEVTGRLAGQLDAWVLAEGVSTSAELRSLAGLDVPLAQGPFIGEPQQYWPEIELTARTVLPRPAASSDGVLRGLLQQAYTATDAAAAASILPETTGFEVLVVVDEHRRPVSMLEHAGAGTWGSSDVLAVNIDTSLPDAVARAMARGRQVRFSPLVCTDNAGRFLGILPIDRLMSHLAEPTSVA
ncbi:EAL domain-containing protein [Jatrophihabitans endophyticus]|uniref:EAL domain-containing protein n=1 Tax=Jatrophihabitans endophyticus TaxID=1206085 RepID=UPI0019E7F455|nr:EAL domain-containing protein [Jatrophihabitans endophyticus]MBE7187791.1 EAL domain-containing protein [Jatrophihabitans endophyticus]